MPPHDKLPSSATSIRYETLELQAFATRAAISSARCVLEIERSSWAAVSRSNSRTSEDTRGLDVAEATPVFIAAINELESHLTPAIHRQAVRPEQDRTAESWEAFIHAAYPHAIAVKYAIIELGDRFEETGRGSARNEDKVHGICGGDVVGLLRVIVRGLMQLYGLLLITESDVLKGLVEMEQTEHSDV